jgi:hypothetical protein
MKITRGNTYEKQNQCLFIGGDQESYYNVLTALTTYPIVEYTVEG